MFQTSFLATAFAVLTTTAMAADLPSRREAPTPYVAAPVFTWTGFYVGVNGGYADPTATIGVSPGGAWVGDPDFPGVANAAARKLTLQGATGGGQVGYNYQVNNVVLGLEADVNALGLSKSYQSPVFPGVVGGIYSANGSVSVNSIVTLRGRLGLAFNNWLFFGTGGVAIAEEKFRQSVNFTNVAAPPPPPPALPFTGPAGGANAGSVSKSSVSWTLGAGVEYAFSNQLSAKVEYLYADLKSLQFGSVYGPNAFDAGTWTMQHRANLSGLNIFRVGINYRFGT
jgi:outer membrane immunogenic protein